MDLRKIRTLAVLALFSILYFLKKELDLIIDINFPLYENKQDENNNYLWKFLIILKRNLDIIEVISIIILLCLFKINIDIFIICIIILSSSLVNFLFQERYIFLFIDKNDKNMKFVRFIDNYGASTLNVILLFYAIYVIIKFFNPFK